MKPRWIHSTFGLVALAIALLTAYAGARLLKARRVNFAIAQASIVSLDKSVPEAALARAIALSRAGDYEGSLLAYKGVIQGPRADLRRLALYNLGNLQMRTALQAPQAPSEQRLPLLEWAKQSYRDLLRETPQDWDARYNLERALYLSPEGDADVASDEPPPPKEHSVATVRAKLDLP